MPEASTSRYSVRLVAGVDLAHAKAWCNLGLPIRRRAGERDYELDGLVVIDSAAFVIEAKAGVMSPAACRASLTEDLDRLVGHSHDQASRAVRYLQARSTATFRIGAETVQIETVGLARHYLVSATLESLSAFVTRVASMQEADLLRPGQLPWSVCELDLVVIVDVLEGAGTLVHYLDRRLAMASLSCGGKRRARLARSLP